MQSEFKNLIQLLKYFEKNETCVAYLEQQRWNGNITCPHCNAAKPYRTARGFKCSSKTCHKKFSVTTQTIYENTKIKLQTWFAAFYLVTSHKKGISSHQLSRDLNITQKSAWFVLHRIREMLREKAPVMLTGTVEIDEMFFGGKIYNKSNAKRRELREAQKNTGTQGKIPVIGLVQRGGNIKAIPVKDTTHISLLPHIYQGVEIGATIYTDEAVHYHMLRHHYNHDSVKHAAFEYVKGDVHTNTIEGFWSIFKRGYYGTYHFISPKHLHRYCDEFAYRYNTRKENSFDRFTQAMQKSADARITYKQLIAK